MTVWRTSPLWLTAPLPKVDRDELGHNLTLQILVDTDTTVLLLCQTGHSFS